MELRDYQDFAVESVFGYFAENSGSPLVVLPTGAGKSVVIAELVRRVVESCPGEQVAIVSHRKEILAQNAQKLQRLLPPSIGVGVYSAGLGKKQIRQITVAGIQSIYRNRNLPPFGLIVADECHLIPQDGDGMYLRFLESVRDRNPDVRLVGLTATAFRTGSGYLHQGDSRVFTDVCCEISVRELIDAGYLVPLVTKHTHSQADLRGVHSRGGEFIAGEAEAAVDKDDLVRAAVEEILGYGVDRNSWLVFCAGVKHAEHVNAALREKGIESRTVFGSTDQGERDRLLRDFKEQRLRALVSVDCLTTGFDAPCTDLIAMLRPTKSAGLWVQALGRGMRLSPETGKTNCLVLDFCGNAMRCGPVDKPVVGSGRRGSANADDEPKEPPVKVCPKCQSCVAPSTRSCPDCGHEWPEPGPKHQATAGTAPVMSDGSNLSTLPVLSVEYRRHSKEGKPDSFRVDYRIGGFDRISEWVCFEHEGFAKRKAARWWRLNAFTESDPPETVDEALDRKWELKRPMSIVVRQEGKFQRVVRVVYEDEMVGAAPTGGEQKFEWHPEEELL